MADEKTGLRKLVSDLLDSINVFKRSSRNLPDDLYHSRSNPPTWDISETRYDPQSGVTTHVNGTILHESNVPARRQERDMQTVDAAIDVHIPVAPAAPVEAKAADLPPDSIPVVREVIVPVAHDVPAPEVAAHEKVTWPEIESKAVTLVETNPAKAAVDATTTTAAAAKVEKTTAAGLGQKTASKFSAFMKDEKLMGKKGLAIGAATIAVGAVVYGVTRPKEAETARA